MVVIFDKGGMGMLVGVVDECEYECCVVLLVMFDELLEVECVGVCVVFEMVIEVIDDFELYWLIVCIC